ncbi:hypothetical protein ACFWJ4_11195 [Kitasatospora sp. NPDC127067]|uniref:hypothetical protein n=1 Tax=Kitasatospora sp. NPDC127067 TaxID=3347126 RepID=UPI003664E5FB
MVETLAAQDGHVLTGDGEHLPVDRALPTTASVLYDALVLSDGCEQTLPSDPDAVRFLTEALRHGKPIAVLGTGVELARAAGLGTPSAPAGVAVHPPGEPVDPTFWDEFAALVERHRFPAR